ncbi:hypothetical protein V8E54_006076 [Elaphomyces granulatus]
MPLSEGWYSMFVARFKLRASQALNKMRDLSYGQRYSKKSQREPSCRQYFDTANRPVCREIPKSLSSLHTWRPKKISGATLRILPRDTAITKTRIVNSPITQCVVVGGSSYGQRDLFANPNQSYQAFPNQNYPPYRSYYPQQQGSNQHPPQNSPQVQFRNYSSTPPAGNRSDSKQKQISYPKQPKLLTDKPACPPTENKYVRPVEHSEDDEPPSEELPNKDDHYLMDYQDDCLRSDDVLDAPTPINNDTEEAVSCLQCHNGRYEYRFVDQKSDNCLLWRPRDPNIS